MKRAKSFILSRLTQDSLLSLIPGFLELSLEHGQVRKYKSGERVCAQGEKLQFLMIPILGILRMHRLRLHEEINVGSLQESRSLGLRQIIFNEVTSFAATSDGDSQVLSIPVDAFLRHIQKHPEIFHYLKLMVSSAGVRAFRDLLTDRRLKLPEIFEILAQIEAEPIVLEAGATLDMRVPSIWFVNSGKLGFRETSRSSSHGSMLEEGAYFGAEALSAPYAYSCEVVAHEPTVLYRVSLQALRPVLKKHQLIDTLIMSSQTRFKATATVAPPKWNEVALPGRRLTSIEIARLKKPVNEADIRFGVAPDNNMFDSVHNFAQFLDHPVQINSLYLDLRQQGLSYASLARSLEWFGFVCRATSCRYRDLTRQPLPSLVGYGPRWAVLLKKDGGNWWLIDPIQGFLAVSESEFKAHWNGEVFYAESAHADWITNSAYKPFEVVLAIFRQASSSLASLFGVRVLGLGLSAVSAKLAGYVVERLSGDAPFSEITWLTLAGLVLFFSITGLSLTSNLITVELDQRFDFKLRTIFFRAVTRLRANSKITLGQLFTYEREFTNLSHFCLRLITHLSFDIATIVLFSILLAFYDWRFPVVGFGLLATLAIIRTTFSGYQRKLFENQIDAAAQVNQRASEIIGSIGAVKAAGAETINRHALEALQLKGWQSRLKTGVFQIGLDGALQILSTFAIAITLYIATTLYISQHIGIGDVMAINMFMMRLLKHLQVLALQIGKFEEVRASAGRINEFFQLPSESITDGPISGVNARLSGHVEFDHVTFGHPGSARPLFSALSFSIYPNQIVAVVGKSGTGKSTLARLLVGQIQPTSGRIFLDGYDINFLSPECKHREIGLVLQKSDLFAGSVLENVAYAADNPSVGQVKSALSLASAEPFVDRMHRGIHHHLGEAGLGLSGGEKQRIAIARSIYSSPNIYVFDEATSALDANSESEVVKNMRKFLAGKTAVIIAHRLSTVRAADRVLVLSEGRVVEDGTHEELILRNGHYAELFGDQFGAQLGEQVSEQVATQLSARTGDG